MLAAPAGRAAMAAMPMRTLSPAEARDLQQAGATVIDVRQPAEFAAAHVPGARNLPLDALDPAAFAAHAGPLLVICQGGGRSRDACGRLAAAGVADVVDIAGGTAAWRAAGLPVEGTGRAVFGVERQVRCVIGAGALAGCILALAVDPWWALLSGFFGAGLLMAGLTGLCPLAVAVAAMPWNRAPAAGSCCAGGRG